MRFLRESGTRLRRGDKWGPCEEGRPHKEESETVRMVSWSIPGPPCCPEESLSICPACSEMVPFTGIPRGSLDSLVTLLGRQHSLNYKTYFIASLCIVSFPECSYSILSFSASFATGPHCHPKLRAINGLKGQLRLSVGEIGWKQLLLHSAPAILFP